MIRWILFDIGGVLAEKKSDATFAELLASELETSDLQLVQKINELHEFSIENGEISELEFPKFVSEKLDFEFPVGSEKAFENAYKRYACPNEKMLKLAKSLRSHGMKTAILSNTAPAYTAVHDEFGINKSDGFAPIIRSYEIGVMKPDLIAYEKALAVLAAMPNEVIFVDDLAENIKAAKSLGISGILHKDFGRTVAEIDEIIASESA